MENPKNIPEKFLKPYDSSETEARVYKLWEESGFFNPDNLPVASDNPNSAKSFTIVMPPPNVTGVLHMGHALGLTLQDIIIRYKRMRGFRTLWIPGTDHAAIATQSKVEKEIKKNEDKSRHDLGREEMLRRIDAFAKDSHDTIVSQIKVMGASCDWSREAFTLDVTRSRAVNTMFKKMYDDGLIYRGNRIVNWDPKGQTTIADDEIVYEERKAKLYTFKYSKDFPISISTTRPETKVGDVAVAVHPDDARYKEFVGKTYEIADFCGVPLSIKIVADESVEKGFGTGALGVTPAHSEIDWEIADRHDLPRLQVISELAKMTVGDERLKGKKVSEAREIIVEWLRAEGLLEKEEEVSQNVATAERTGGIIEPLPKLQWFINVNAKFKLQNSKLKGLETGMEVSLKEIMKNAVSSRQVAILPEHFDKTYFHWIENLRDWCISRQIWYGHRVPVWYCLHCKKQYVNLETGAKIYLTRHGETDSNKEGRIAGSIDLPLNQTGTEQAMVAAQKLKNENIDYIICSNLIRAKETAEIIQKEIGGEIIIDPELREREYGVVEGMYGKDIKPLKTYQYEGKPENGESYKEVEERIHNAFVSHRKKFEGKNILVVSHGGALRTLMKRLLDLDPMEMLARTAIKNADVIQIEISKPCENCKNDIFEQDPDTLDTWFSSGTWTFSTLGWPIDKKMGMNEKFVERIKSGDKTNTTRLEKKDWNIGDILQLENTQTGELFGYARITNIEEIPLTAEKKGTLQEYYGEKDLTEVAPTWKYSFVYSEKSDLETYHPTDVIVPAYEILFHWIARMILMSGYALETIPFHTVYLTGIVRDAKGRKFSKSLGNGIDPIEIAKKFGADAGRMALVVGTAAGTDMKISEDKIKGYRNFSNKIWNITRFVMENVETESLGSSTSKLDEIMDEWKKIAADITDDMENFRFHLASEKIYHYVWHRFADEIIEQSKTDAEIKSALIHIWTDCLKILHPFMPFVTEEIWALLPAEKRNLLMVEKWPTT